MKHFSIDPIDLRAFQDENQQLRELLSRLVSEKELLEQQVNELEAEVLVQEQLSVRETQGFQYYQTLFFAAPTALLLIDVHARLVDINQKAGELFQVDPELVRKENLRTWLKKESGIELLGALKSLQEGQQSGQKTLHLQRGDLLIYRLTRLQGDLSGCFLLVMESVHLDQLTSQSLFLANSVIEQLREAVMITDAKGHIIRINQAFSQITGYTSEEALGNTPQLLNSGRHDDHFYKQFWSEIKHHGWWQGEVWNRRKTGEVFPEWLQVSRVHDEFTGRNYYVGIFSDISERKVHQDQLDRLAFYDLLTGLPNRTLMTRFLDTRLMRAAESDELLALLFIDLDKFKEVNDHFGHAEGDLVLREATQRLISQVKEDDLAARIGGDEFVVILSRFKQQAEAEQVAASLIRLLSEPYVTSKSTHYLSASIGLAFYPAHGRSVEDLMRRADAAMYRAKHQGRNTWTVFDAEQEIKTQLNRRLIKLLWKAVAEPEKYIQMHYQPIFAANNPGQPCEYEALVRLQDDEGQLIFPDEFIQLAEEDVVCSPFGEAIFKAVCHDFQRYQLGSDLVCCINLSAMQFRQADLLARLEQVALSYGLALEQFNFEVTETAMMHNMSLMLDTLTQIRQAGSSISLDDFGTGYASLSMLRSLPVNVLKIDRSFTQDLERSEETRTLVKAMIAMAKALGLRIITEGVENQRQLDWLHQQQVDQVQGYLLGKPHPASYWFGGGHASGMQSPRPARP